jgi:hypothetical protein
MEKCLFLVMLLSFHFSFSQDWNWSIHLGRDGSENVDLGQVKFNSQNEIILVSHNAPTSTPPSVPSTQFYLNGNTYNVDSGNVFLAKLNNSGSTIWVKHLFSDDVNFYGKKKIIIDKIDDSFYLYGGYSGSYVSDCDSDYLNANIGMFISKFDNDGNCLWNKKIHNSLIDEATSCTLDDSGNVYLASWHWSNVYFDTILVNGGTVISKFSPDGNLYWSKNICYLTDDGHPRPMLEIRDLKYKDGSLYLHSYENHDTITIDSTTIIHPLQRASMIAKLSAHNLNLIWYKEGIGYNPQPCWYQSITLDSHGNIYATGNFLDSINFDGQILYGPQNSNVVDCETYLIKYDSTGTKQWIRQFYNSQSYPGESSTIVTTSDGFTYLASDFRDSTTIGNNLIYSNANQDMVLSLFSPTGACTAIKHFGSAKGLNVDIDGNGDVVVISQMDSVAVVDTTTYYTYGDFDNIISKCASMVGIEETERSGSNGLLIYANPTTGICNIEMPEDFLKSNKTLTLYIYDNSGKLVRTFPVKVSYHTISLDLDLEATGMYNVSLSDGQKSYQGRIIFE